MFFRSIRCRLTLWYLFNLAVVLAVFSTFLYLFIREQLYSGADASLLMISESLASPTMEPFREADSSVIGQVLEDFIGEKSAGKIVRFLDLDGSVRVSSGPLQKAELRLGKKALQEAASGRINFSTVAGPASVPYRVIAFPLYHDGKLYRIIQVGTSLKEPAQTLNKILVAFVISVPIGLLILVTGGWFLAGRALKPVDDMTRTIRSMSAESLGERLEVENPGDEIGRLAETFNEMLTRVDHAFTKVRQFSSDVSHELRTPLTIMRGETEVALRWAKEPEQFREALQSSLEEITRMTGMIEKLLELEKVERGGSMNLETVDLSEFLNEQAKGLEDRCRDEGLDLQLELDGPVLVQGDRARLRQVLTNLVDNAINASSAGASLFLACSAGNDGSARLVVRDTGSGIPHEHLAKIFDPFYRVDSARNRNDGGSGLGLSLVNALVKVHRGRVEVQSTPGQGSEFTVILPSAQS